MANVRHHVIDALSAEQVTQLAAIADAILERIDPAGVVMSAQRGDPPAEPVTA